MSSYTSFAKKPRRARRHFSKLTLDNARPAFYKSRCGATVRSVLDRPASTAPRAREGIKTPTGAMAQATTIGLDIAKHVFQLHVADATGQVLLRKRVTRSKLVGFLAVD
jgi:hypothetical protein